MIKDPTEMTFTDKKFSMILYGPPGMGKSTIALSAPDPIHIDFDRGVSRVSAHHRKTTIVCGTYEEVLKDMQDPKVLSCQTIIIDTGGSFITYLQDWAMRDNPAMNRQKNGSISLKGFGAVKAEFSRFTSHVRDVMNKNVIYVFHSVEEKDKDGNPIQRLLCEGAARNIVWQPCDFGAYMQMIGNKRSLSFTPEQEFFAKGCHGITGRFDVTELGISDKNDLLTRLFDKARANITAESDAFTGVKDKYEAAMSAGREIVDSMKDIDSANAAMPKIKAIEHALTSETEVGVMFKAKIKELGLFYDSVLKKYTAPPPEGDKGER